MTPRPTQNWFYQETRSDGPFWPKKKDAVLKKQKKTAGQEKSEPPKKKRWKKILKITGYVFLALAIFILAVFLWVAKDLPSSKDILSGRLVDQATQIYDRTGEHLLYEIHGDENRTLVKLTDLPKHIPEATIAIEDDAFYHHFGFDVQGIIRAAWKDITGQGYSQGGSTITQQLIKNTILTPEKTFTRKVKELIMAIELEIKLSKNDILELYLNAIPYGSNAYGIEAASQNYFSKPAAELDLAQAALLAGIAQAPTYYSPINHPERAKNRQEKVLDRMVEEGYITEAEATDAKAEDIKVAVRKNIATAPHFVDYLKEILVEKYGIKKVETGGLKVISTLNLDHQKIAEEVLAEQRAANQKYDVHNGALVSVDAKTGEILAMVGSVDYYQDEDEGGKMDGQVNVTTSYRSPGSSIKPLEYATAFARGFPPTTMVYDVRTSFGADGSGQEYIPKNFSGGFAGPISFRSALQQSLNIPAVKAYYLAGAENVSTMAAKLGYDNFVAGKEYGLATAIGGKEVMALDHVGMFQAFSNRGKFMDPTGILKVTDWSGNVLEEIDLGRGTQVMDQNVADNMNNVLSDNNARTWGKRELVLKDRPVAAKTGTSNKEFGGGIRPNNLWTCGYTPQIATAVWVGNSNGSALAMSAEGLINAAPIWQKYMNRVHEGLPVEEFSEPQTIESNKPILQGRLSGEVEVEICQPSGLLANEYCPAAKREKKKFRDAHCILYYVNRLDPLGDRPKNPKDDPQFKNWEDGVRAWAESSDFGGIPPTETDTLHNPENWPSISITTPSSGATITSGIFSVAVNVSGKNQIKEVVYTLDGKKVGSATKSPFGADLVIPAGLTNGFHTLSATVYDIADNKAETNLDLNFKVTNVKPSVSLMSPGSGTTVSGGGAVLVSAKASGSTPITRVEFFAQKPDGEVSSFGADSSPDGSGLYGMTWTAGSDRGTYYLFAQAQDEAGNTAQSGKAAITVN